MTGGSNSSFKLNASGAVNSFNRRRVIPCAVIAGDVSSAPLKIDQSSHRKEVFMMETLIGLAILAAVGYYCYECGKEEAADSRFDGRPK